MRPLHILFCLVLSVTALSAQDNFLKDYAPISPTPASLGKYGDIPVSPHTGVPDISIPIYTFQEGALTVPVSLSYHASGIRVEEVASWVGLGWALNAGGVITRSIQHSPDEAGEINQITGYYRDYGHPLDPNTTVCDTFKAAATGYFDTEPDLFSFNIAGYNGKFFFDKNRVLHTVPEQDDIRIEPYIVSVNGTVSFKGWVVIAPDGTRYHFGATDATMDAPSFIEYTAHLNLADPSTGSYDFPSSWFLSKIESADLKDVITFTYVPEKYGFFMPGSNTSFALANTCPSSSAPTYPIKTSVNGKRLASISGVNNTILFTGETTPREDLSVFGHCPYCTNINTEAKSLKTIEIRDKWGGCVRKFDFSYTYVQAPAGSFPSASIPVDNVDRKRLVLNSVTESACTTTVNSKVHSFEYYDLNLLPRRCALSVDHWGYNNGKSNGTLMPGYPYIFTAHNQNCLFVNYNSSCGLLPNGYADREPAFPEMRHGTLKKITYPTGGTTTFEFEAHQARVLDEVCTEALIEVWNAVPPPSNCVDPGSATRTYTFSQSDIDNGNLKLELTLNPGCFNGNIELEIFLGNNPWGTSVAYVQIPVPTGNNYVSQTYELTNIGGPGLLANTAYTFLMSAVGGISAATIWTYSRSQAEVNKTIGGLRIKKITTSDGLTSNNIVKNYEYQLFTDATKTSGTLMYMPVYTSGFNYYILHVLAGPGDYCSLNNGLFECFQIPYAVFSSTGLNPMYSGQGSHIGYTNISMYETGNGKTRYTYSLLDAYSYPTSNYPFIQVPFNAYFGRLLKEEHFAENGNKIFERSHTYLYGGSLISNGWDAFKVSYVPLGLQCQGGTHNFEYVLPYTFVPLVTIYHLPSTTVERTYNVGTSTYVEKSYAYNYSIVNGHYQKTSEEVTNSDGTVYRTKYKYARDYPCPASGACDETSGTANAEGKAIYAMRKRNIVSQPIEQTTWLKKTAWGSFRLTGATYFQFDKVNASYNNIKLKAVHQVRPASPLTTFVESTTPTTGIFSKDANYALEYNFAFSDTHGKLLSQWKQNDPARQQYIWGQRQKMPIAKIINAEANEVAFSSFEDPGVYTAAENGNWAITPANSGGWNANAGYAQTGRNGYDLNTRTLTASSVPAGSYIVSFWHRDGTVSVNGTAVSTAGATLKYAERALTLAAAGNVTVTGTGYIDELRLHPSDALMQSFSYDDRTLLPLSITDENHVSAHFEFDNFQRLQAIRDQDRNILQTYEYNYRPGGGFINDIKARTTLISGQTTIAQVNALTGANVRRIFQYMDGLGRPIQSSQVEQSPTSKDIVTYQQYDQYGRESKLYIPYTATTNSGIYRTDAATAQTTFANTWGAGGYGYSETRFEASPLNRVLEQAAPGATWRMGLGHTGEFTYRGNTTTEAVRDFTNNNSFAADKLFVVESTDENERKKYTYTDKLGRVVMVKQQMATNPTIEDDHYARTYTVYDDFGRVAAVIPPEAAKKMKTSGSWDWTLSTYASMIYKYVYDSRGRLTSKTIPSAGTTSIAYDRLDRPVLTTDAKGFKTFTRYDILSRPVVSGRYKGAAAPGGSDPLFETPNTTAPHYYTSTAFPTDNNLDVYKVLYYDDYDIDNNGSLGAGETYTDPAESGYETAAFLRTRGKPTVVKTAILKNDNTAPTTYLTTRTYYDKEYSVIQINKQNHLSGSDIISNAYDFANRLTKTRRDHTATPPGGTLKTYAIREEYVYDHAGRLRFTRHKINSNNWTVTSAPLYDELNRLADKRLHASNYDGTSTVTLASSFNYLQSLDYTYNIRGCLTGINDVANCSIQAGDQLADMFKLQLSYDAPVGGGTAQYNGNIATMQWRTYINSTCLAQQQYRFSYDGANRLTGADHYTNSSGTWTFTNNYTESNITYDLNGNIKSYTRRGLTTAPSTFGNIDQLTYFFEDAARPDRLTRVVDAASATKGFVYNAAATTPHYVYDLNGNLVEDKHKGLSISYNHLNLPNFIFNAGGADITMTYTADGEKLSKVSSTGTRNYVTGIEYLGANLDAIYHAEGRCTANGATAFYYEYTIKDHLGNARVNFRANGAAVTFLEDLHYYPFGMLMEGIGMVASSNPNKYRFNGIEQQEDLGLNLGLAFYRAYDPTLGRWCQIDPKPNYSTSSYSSMNNNPILYLDMLGDTIKYSNEAMRKFIEGYSKPTYVNKNGKEKKNNSYNADFALIIEALERSPEVFEFTDDASNLKSENSLGEFTIEEDGSHFNIIVPSWSGSGKEDEEKRNGGRTFALFEEVFHAGQYLGGKIIRGKDGNKHILEMNKNTTSALVEAEAKIFAADRAGIDSYTITRDGNPYTISTWAGLIRNTEVGENRVKTVAEMIVSGTTRNYPSDNPTAFSLTVTHNPPYKTH